MSETLLFLHVLAGAALFGTIVAFSAVALGATVDRRSIAIANVLWGGALILTLILGLALAIDYDAYEPWDGWVLAAIVLWLAAGGTGDAAQRGLREGEDGEGGEGGMLTMESRQRLMHWIRVAIVIALLVIMVWKPGA